MKIAIPSFFCRTIRPWDDLNTMVQRKLNHGRMDRVSETSLKKVVSCARKSPSNTTNTVLKSLESSHKPIAAQLRAGISHGLRSVGAAGRSEQTLALTPIASRAYAITEKKPDEEIWTPKRRPYLSEKRDASINWNGVVSMRASHAGVIECRHLAQVWARNFESTRGRTEYRDFESPESIRRSVSPLAERNFEARVLGAYGYLVENGGWGNVLAECVREMVVSAEDRRSLLAVTPNHVLAFGIKLKHEGARRHCIVQFYDPNQTVTHLRAKLRVDSIDRDGLGEILALRAEDFLSPFDMKEYDLPHDGSTLFLGEPATHGASRLRCMPEGTPSAITLNQLCFANLSGELGTAISQIFASGLSPEQCSERLSAKDSEGTSGLHLALQGGYVATVHTYVESILKSQLSDELKVSLLAGTAANGLPGICMALQKGHAETVRAYAGLVLGSDLSSTQKLTLMAAHRPDGAPGVWAAFRCGHADAIRAYMKLIATSRLSGEQRCALLAAKDPDGEPSVIEAFRCGHTNVVRVYVESVLTSGLSNEQQFDLLAAMDREGISGMRHASMSGHTDTVSAFIDLIESSTLPAQLRMQLLDGLGRQKHGASLRIPRHHSHEVSRMHFSTRL
ncbi:ShET2/EspL2 family type III secretion system effector toxin [Pandoraea fibrosis]|uniref:ShET2/EspL2 family type III secretion system effector toxin n=1 Tax=Pandoraea fibrosis TaxID=1891094 RepID=UPI001241A4A8|nr:ShET2/EspL2 family type III secretion system effector toxin [Pandoraea fibrosis]